MSDNELPDNLVSVADFVSRVRPGRKCEHERYVVDDDNKVITCGKCNSEISAFEAMSKIAHGMTNYAATNKRLYEERKALIGWQPRLIAIRELQKVWQGNTLPACKHCGRGLLPEDMVGIRVSKQRELERREFEKNKEKKP